MSSTRFDVIVFDFDGTLVQSAALKRQVFFEVFPCGCAPAVASILSRDPDGSRYRVIPEIIAQAELDGWEQGNLHTGALTERYGRLASAAVERAPEMPGAGELLRMASQVASLYVASVTPHDDLRSLLDKRGWLDLLSGAYGHPHQKAEVVARLLKTHEIDASRLLVVGDGASDREAAERNGCPFHLVRGPGSLAELQCCEALHHV